MQFNGKHVKDPKEKILSLLSSVDDFLSGEEVSAALEMTRSAVWKHIKQLRREGFIIEARSKRGYRLREMPDRLLPYALRRGLHTAIWGQELHYFPSLDSTNTFARSLADKGSAEGTAVIAEEQTRGRGRRGREWSSPFGLGIWTSLILRPPNLEPKASPLITLMAAVAVREAIAEVTGVAAGIKWPNDLLVNNRKVCGILTEVKAELDLLHYAIIGCGINANQKESDFPPELHGEATSLAQVSRKKINRLRLWQSLFEKTEEFYRELTSGNFKLILHRWRESNVTLGRQVQLTSGQHTLEGTALDINEEGALIVEDLSGRNHHILAGDITFLD